MFSLPISVFDLSSQHQCSWGFSSFHIQLNLSKVFSSSTKPTDINTVEWCLMHLSISTRIHVRVVGYPIKCWGRGQNLIISIHTYNRSCIRNYGSREQLFVDHVMMHTLSYWLEYNIIFRIAFWTVWRLNNCGKQPCHHFLGCMQKIGRASCRERVCMLV